MAANYLATFVQIRQLYGVITDRRLRLKIVVVILASLLVQTLDIIAVLITGALTYKIINLSTNQRELENSGGITAVINQLGEFFSLTPTSLGLMVLSLLMIRSVVSFMISVKIYEFFQANSERITEKSLEVISKISPRELDKVSVEEGNFVLTDGYRIAHVSYPHTLILLITEAMFLLIMTTSLFYIDFVTTCGVVIVFFIITWIQTKLIGNRIGQASVRFTKHVLDTRSTWSTLRESHKEYWSSGKTYFFVDRMSKSIQGTRKSSSEMFLLQSMPRFLMEVLTTLVLGILVFLGARQQTLISSLPSISMLTIGLLRVIPSLIRLQGHILAIQSMSGGLQATIEFQNKLKTVYNSLNNENRVVRKGFIQTKSLFVKVKEHFVQEKKSFYLRGIEFSLKTGDTLLIVGSSGSGKTSLADLILGLSEPLDGSILLNRHKSSELSQQSRNKISYVPQKTSLISGSLQENLIFDGQINSKTTERIFELLHQLGLGPFLNALDFGINSKIGANFREVSGGEKQRIAIARALLNNPELLVLDESTNALDKNNEVLALKVVKKNMKRGITILISHSQTSLDFANKVLVLSNGQQILFKELKSLTNSELKTVSQKLTSKRKLNEQSTNK